MASSGGSVGGISGLRGPSAIDDSRRQRRKPKSEELEQDSSPDSDETRSEDLDDVPRDNDGPRKGQFIDERC